MPRVMLPSSLAKLAQKQRELLIPGETLLDVAKNIIQTYPGFTNYLFDTDGNLSTYINFYLNGQDIRYLDHEKTSVNDDDIISIVAAISGG